MAKIEPREEDVYRSEVRILGVWGQSWCRKPGWQLSMQNILIYKYVTYGISDRNIWNKYTVKQCTSSIDQEIFIHEANKLHLII